MVNSGQLRPDGRQIGAMKRLDDLYNCIQSNPQSLQPQRIAPSASTPLSSENIFSSISNWFSSNKSNPSNSISNNTPSHVKPVTQAELSNADCVPCKSLYIYGGVGCGKTMLMDIFYHRIDTQYKLRQHFHGFMLDIHKQLHQLRMTRGDTVDPLSVVSSNIGSMYRLICLDEFQVTDVADAMILRRLFSNLFSNGVILVATSNRMPSDLYANGINRSEFLPFIDVLQAYCHVHEMGQGSDHRLMGTLSHGMYTNEIDNHTLYAHISN